MEASESSSSHSEQQVSQPRHSLHCSFCRHPERHAIEQAFLYRQMSVAEIKIQYGVGHDAVYRHAHALGLLEPRNRNWRAPVEPDWSVAVSSTNPAGTESVEHSPSTPYATTMLELLGQRDQDGLLPRLARAIDAKASRENLSIEASANQIFIAAALLKIEKGSDKWLDSFEGLIADQQGE